MMNPGLCQNGDPESNPDPCPLVRVELLPLPATPAHASSTASAEPSCKASSETSSQTSAETDLSARYLSCSCVLRGLCDSGSLLIMCWSAVPHTPASPWSCSRRSCSISSRHIDSSCKSVLSSALLAYANYNEYMTDCQVFCRSRSEVRVQRTVGRCCHCSARST